MVRSAACLQAHAVTQMPLDVLDHDDGVVDHDADREHQSEQRYEILIANPSAAIAAKVPTSDTGIATIEMIAVAACRNTSTTTTTSSIAS